MNFPPVVLFNEPKTVGGTPVMVVRLAAELKRLGVEFLVIDLHGGFVREELQKLQISCIVPDELGKRRKIDRLIPQNAVFIGFNYDPYQLAGILDETTARLLVWDVFPPIWLDGFLKIEIPFLRPLLNSSRWASNGRKRLATMMMDRGGVVFMEEPGLENAEVLTQKKWPDATIIPIPAQHSPSPRTPRLVNGDEISCFYVGRSDLWKVVPCRRIIEDFGSKGNIRWTILTDSASRFRDNLGGCEPARMNIVEGVRGADLDQMLLNDADICFAMGTSCLEGAKLGVPSILMDFVLSKNEMPRPYGYRWLYQEPGSCLGRDVGGCLEVPGMNAEQVLGAIRSDAGAVGQLCWEAVRAKFAISIVTGKLLVAAQKTQLTMGDYSNNNLFRLARLGYLWRQFRARKDLRTA
jgi:hypothetical protein